MDYIIREIKKEEYDLLNDFLYNAIYIPDGVEPPPKSIINCPELQEYVFEFGKRKDDRALVAEVQGNVVGAIWVRIMNDYGHIDNDTPSLAMSVFKSIEDKGLELHYCNSYCWWKKLLDIQNFPYLFKK